MGIHFRRRHSSTASITSEPSYLAEYQIQTCNRRRFPRFGRRSRRESSAASTTPELSNQLEPEPELEPQQRPWILWLLAMFILWWVVMAIILKINELSRNQSAYTIKPGETLLSSIDGKQAHIVSASHGDPCSLGKAAGYPICIMNKRSSWWS